MDKVFKIVLVEPDIPQNTGNIARLCACTGAELYLVGKLGFQITDKHVKRAGLDYWGDVKIEQVASLTELHKRFKNSKFYYLSTKAKRKYTDIQYFPGDFLVFGSETRGLPEEIIENNPDTCLKIPMKENQRSLNLSNCAAIVLYEAIRQTDILSI